MLFLTLERVAQLHAPSVAVTKILLNLAVVVGHVDHDLLDAVVGQVFDKVFHHRLAQNRDHRFREVLGEWAHAGALPRRQNHAFCHS